MRNQKNITILLAEDEAVDHALVAEALEDNCAECDLHWVKDGSDLTDYLFRRGRYSDPMRAPRPDLILLDLHMPRKSGLEALQEIKAEPALRHIPVVVFTSSRLDSEIMSSYQWGASSFVQKPRTFDHLSEVINEMRKYWTGVVRLPPRDF
ncbi:MAG: response regulator [Abitibacteriaceae bacterium]|nr:response regulator [Abditibacteriaceae bacterium]MBV9863764.1 response regulator [Abditibacteriaceae bacterium]